MLLKCKKSNEIFALHLSNVVQLPLQPDHWIVLTFSSPFFLQLWTSENQGDEGDAGEGEN